MPKRNFGRPFLALPPPPQFSRLCSDKCALLLLLPAPSPSMPPLLLLLLNPMRARNVDVGEKGAGGTTDSGIGRPTTAADRQLLSSCGRRFSQAFIPLSIYNIGWDISQRFVTSLALTDSIIEIKKYILRKPLGLISFMCPLIAPPYIE